MQDQSPDHRLHRIERQLNAVVILLGVLVTLAIFTVVSNGLDHAPFLLFVLLPGVFIVLLVTYLISAILTPGRPRADSETTTSGAEAE